MAKKNHRQTCGENFSQLDLFGRPISLTHEGRHMFTSYVGAVNTVLFIIIIIALGLTKFFDVFFNQILNASVSLEQESVDFGQGLNPTNFGFNFAWGLANSTLLDPTIATVRIQHVTRRQQKNYTNDENTLLNFSQCLESDLINVYDSRRDDVYDRRFPSQTLNCLEDNRFNLKGDKYSEQFDYVQLDIQPCFGQKCQSQAQVQEYFRQRPLLLYMTDISVDTSDADDTVKRYLNANYHQKIDIFQQSKVDLQIQKSKIKRGYFSKDISQEAYKLGSLKMRAEMTGQPGDSYFSLRFCLDDEKLVLTLSTYELVSWISQMGGLLSAFLVFFQVLVFHLSEVLLIQSIMNSLYFIRKNPSDTKKKNKVNPIQNPSPATPSTLETNTSQYQDTQLKLPLSSRNMLPMNHQSSVVSLKIEQDEYQNLVQNLQCYTVSAENIQNIINTIFLKRIRFSSIYSFLLLSFISYMELCPCLKRKFSSATRRKIKIFENGKRKFLRELDVVNLLQNVRVSRFLSNQQLSGRQKTLLQFQHSNLVDSESEIEMNNQCEDHRLIRDDFHSKNKLVKVFAVGKMNRYLKEYLKDEDISQIDVSLFKGFYTNQSKEVNLDYKRALLTPPSSKEDIEIKETNRRYNRGFHYSRNRVHIRKSTPKLTSRENVQQGVDHDTSGQILPNVIRENRESVFPDINIGMMSQVDQDLEIQVRDEETTTNPQNQLLLISERIENNPSSQNRSLRLDTVERIMSRKSSSVRENIPSSQLRSLRNSSLRNTNR